MKILFVTPPPFFPNRLHRIRSIDLIKMLSTNGNEVHLLACITKGFTKEEYSLVKKYTTSITTIKQSSVLSWLSCLLHPFLPLEVAYCFNPYVKKTIEKIIKSKKIDLVYAKRLRSGIYLSSLAVPVILDSTDAMSMFYFRLANQANFFKRFYYFWEGRKYRWYENKIKNNVDHFVVCSEVDKNYLEKRGMKNISVIPNGVDTEYYAPVTSSKKSPTILLSGLMEKPVNSDAAMYFAKEIFPRILSTFPNVILQIVGPSPQPPVIELENKQISVTGYVSDIREYIANADVIVCPVRVGSGTRNKILQAWAMRKPVVSTSIGAEGFLYKDGENILIADTPEVFAKKIILLLQDRKVYTRIATQGLKTTQSHYSLEVIEKELEKILITVKKNHAKKNSK